MQSNTAVSTDNIPRPRIEGRVREHVKCQMFVYSGHALSYTKLVHRHATQTEGNKYFK